MGKYAKKIGAEGLVGRLGGRGRVDLAAHTPRRWFSRCLWSDKHGGPPNQQRTGRFRFIPRPPAWVPGFRPPASPRIHTASGEADSAPSRGARGLARRETAGEPRPVEGDGFGVPH